MSEYCGMRDRYAALLMLSKHQPPKLFMTTRCETDEYGNYSTEFSRAQMLVLLKAYVDREARGEPFAALWLRGNGTTSSFWD